MATLDLLVPLIGAMLWRGGTSAGALTSIAVGGTLVAVLMAWAGLDSDAPIYAGLAGSAVSYVLVSLLTRAKR
jgi:SSS family solute:Na+ symporter